MSDAGQPYGRVQRSVTSAHRVATRPLGRSGIELTELGVGAAGLGNLYAPICDQAAAEVMDAAWNAGCRYVDTAPYYGFGLSERRVGDALRKQEPSPDGWVISTKVGRVLRAVRGDPVPRTRHGFVDALPFSPHFDYSAAGIRRSIEDSLQRLGRAHVDIALVHDIGTETLGDASLACQRDFWDGGYRALKELQAEGVIRAIGVGVNEWQICETFMQRAEFDCFLLAGRYTLLEQDALQSFMPACERRGIGVILGGIYNSGILATGVSDDRPAYYNYAPAPGPIRSRVRELQAVCGRHSVSLPVAALQFALAHPVVASVIPGLVNPTQVGAALSGLSQEIPDDFWSELKQMGLLDLEAPTPRRSGLDH